MTVAAALIYWVIVGLWICLLATLLIAYMNDRKRFAPVRLLLWVVAIDTMRNIIENVYFGLYFGSKYGLFHPSIAEVLGIPQLLFIPKVVNVVAAITVLFLLIFRWLPKVVKDQAETQKNLKQTERSFQLLIDGVSEYAIYLLDTEGRVKTWNSGAERIKGYSAHEIIGRPFETFYSDEDRAAGLAIKALKIAARVGRYETKGWRVRKDGSRFWANVVIDTIKDENGAIVGYAKVTKDITESMRAEEKLIQLAHYDQLTGLPNRTSLMAELRKILDQKQAVSIALFDLDGFKIINDTQGHSAGDHVLEEIADRSREVIGSSEEFFRLGGDEFVLVAPSQRDPIVFATVVNSLLRRFEEPMEINGKRVLVGASAGIAIAPSDGNDSEQLLSHADLALYEAKESGGHRYSLFVPTMRAKLQARQKLEVELQRACAAREFVLFYQPQVRLSDGKIVGAEALLRWQHPERGLLPPAVFLDVLQNSAMALEIGDWILHTACLAAAGWRANGFGDLRVGVNLFASQFHDVDLVDQVGSALGKSGIAPEMLELEITENIAFGQDDKTLATLRALRGKGVGLAFDDFGTGYASLSYLTKYPLTRVKIDRSFVRNIAKHSPQEVTAVVRSMIVMAHNLGFDVIAEGVETQDQADFLQAKRCDEVQGYLYATPLPEADFKAFLQNYRSMSDANVKRVGMTSI